MFCTIWPLGANVDNYTKLWLQSGWIYMKREDSIRVTRISVVVPVYNVKAYVERCLNSILQSCGDKYQEIVEILLIDDGSTDGSGSLCDQLSHKYHDWVRTYHKDNGGLASARNEGIRRAKGDYILFVDSDDWIDQKTIPKLMDQIDKFHPDLVKFGYNRIENGVCIRSEYPALECRFYSEDEVKTKLRFDILGNGRLFDYSRNYLISACMTLYKRELLERSGIMFESERIYLNEDVLFNLKLIAFVTSAVVLSDCFYNYDCRQESLTQTYKTEMYKRKCAFLDNYLLFAEKNGLNDGEDFKGRYSQLVIQHLYECAVSECNWNPDSHDRFRKLSIILNDKRMKNALKNLDNIQLNPKACMMKWVIQTANPRLFHYLYKISRLKTTKAKK